MSRSEKKRKNQKALEKRQKHIIESICDELKTGVRLTDLKSKHSPKLLKFLFAILAEQNPSLLTTAFGTVASPHKILIDECLDTGLIETVHRNIGQPHTVEHMFEKSIKDKQLYPLAQQNKINAIITCDSRGAGQPDICGIAQRAFQQNNNEHSPSIMIVSPNTERAIYQIRSNTMRIMASWKRNPSILDLRVLN